MNYASFIVKIVEKPKQHFFKDDTFVTQVLVKFTQIRESNLDIVFQISIWGNLGEDVIQYYRVNDYIIIEGYISLRQNLFNSINNEINKQVSISICKIYPFILNNAS
jgi:single-stranded DNA-binding protein